jgi:hypothetical protein
MFVMLQAEGLVHVSNISSARLGSAKEAVERGQDVWVKVVSVRCAATPSWDVMWGSCSRGTKLGLCFTPLNSVVLGQQAQIMQ